MSFLLAHLSDLHLPHLPDLSLRDFFSKRLLGYLNWRRGRGDVHRGEVLQKLIADLLESKPDHIALTGDLTNLALPTEFERAQAWMRAFTLADKISFVPGNHDAYVPNALEMGYSFLTDWLPHGASSFPYINERGRIALIGLSSAIPTLPFLSAGRIGVLQAKKLGEILKKLGEEKKCRIVLVHHPLHVRRSEWAKRLFDTERLKNVLIEHGAELVLHGHLHRPTEQWLEGKNGPVPVIGVPSASADPGLSKQAAGYALFRISERGAQWNIEMTRRILTLDGTFVVSEQRPLTAS